MNRNTYVHTFKEPFEYEDKTYKELVFEFDKLKGKDIISIQNEILSTGGTTTAPELDTTFQAKFAAKAAGIGSDVIENLPAKDFMRVTSRTRNFLLGLGY